eukprot:8846552-Pyramimonas_sp.AAC.1
MSNASRGNAVTDGNPPKTYDTAHPTLPIPNNIAVVTARQLGLDTDIRRPERIALNGQFYTGRVEPSYTSRLGTLQHLVVEPPGAETTGTPLPTAELAYSPLPRTIGRWSEEGKSTHAHLVCPDCRKECRGFQSPCAKWANPLPEHTPYAIHTEGYRSIYDDTPCTIGSEVESGSAAAGAEYQIHTEGYRSVYDEAPVTMGESSSRAVAAGEYRINTEGYRIADYEYSFASPSGASGSGITAGEYQINTEGYRIAEYEVSGFRNP